MTDVTDADRERAVEVVPHSPACDGWRSTPGLDCICRAGELRAPIAVALAKERERGIDIGLQNATSIDHFEVGHCCRLCGQTWPCDRARTVGLR